MPKLLNTPLNIGTSLDNIFGAIMIGGLHKDSDNYNYEERLKEKVEVLKIARSKFISTFQFNIFNDLYAIFYEIIVTYNVKEFTLDQLDSILEQNKDLIVNSPYIDRDKFSRTDNNTIANDDDFFEAMRAEMRDKFITLSELVVEIDAFDSSCIIYIDWYKSAYMESICQDMSIIMQDMGLDVKLPGKRRRHYQGLEDTVEYWNENMRIIKSLEDESRIRSTVINEHWLQDELQNENKNDDKALFNIGIKEMDATIGELRRGNMVGIMGPPKGGKTRFTNYLVQRALSMGYNVCVWPLEGTQEEWLAMQTACYLAATSYHNIKAGKSDQMVRIDSKDILQKKYLGTKTIREAVAAAKQTMAISENYGRLSFIEGTAYVEDMFDVLKGHYDSENPFDVLVIDQLVNVMSKTGKGKVERISEAYMLTKDFLANKLKRPALGLMPAQLKQDAVDNLRAHPDADLDVTSGGESAETIRTPDETIGLFSSKEERDSNMMKIYSVASRHNGSFQNFTARCYLGCCFFLSEEDDITQGK